MSVAFVVFRLEGGPIDPHPMEMRNTKEWTLALLLQDSMSHCQHHLKELVPAQVTGGTMWEKPMMLKELNFFSLP